MSLESQKTNSKPRIMIVDDQPDALRLVQLRLEKVGMECLTFKNGHEALKFLNGDTNVDVIVLDIMMPMIDGYEVCRRIKASPQIQDIPVIFLTAKLESSDKVQGLDIGGHDYLTKPVQQQELVARTKAAVRVKQLQDELKEKIALQQSVKQLHQEMLSAHWLKTLGQLSTSLAHEINNPLAAASGNIQLLLMQRDLDEPIRKSLEVAERGLSIAGQKMRSLLAVAQSGGQTEDHDLAVLVEDMVSAINFQAVMSKVTVTKEIASDCVWNGTSGDLARVLLYVLNNAIEAVQDVDGPRIHVKLYLDATVNVISVFDNGVGIDEAARPRIFDQFFTTKPKHQGIGLTLVMDVLKRIGGYVEVFEGSDPWITEVRVQLPRVH